MANFEAYQEYQRIEDIEEDSPPGEEDLLVHVPEGLKGKHVIMTKEQVVFDIIDLFRCERLVPECY